MVEFRAKDDRKGYVTKEQVNLLMDYFQNKAASYPTESHLYMVNMKRYLLIRVMFTTGRRVSEVLGIMKQRKRAHGLRPIDIDYDSNKITWSILKKNQVKRYTKAGNLKKSHVIAEQKFNKPTYSKTIITNTKLMNTLRYWIKEWKIPNTHRIFPFTKDYFNRELKKACIKLKIKLDGKRVRKDKFGNEYEDIYWISSHSFRHGYAQAFLKSNNTDPKALPILSRNMCHSSLKVTDVYLHDDDETAREMAEKKLY